MRRYFERLERCTYENAWGEYVPDHALKVGARILNRSRALLDRVLGERAPQPTNPGRHGFDGWLTTSSADPALLLDDPELLDVVAAAVKKALFGHVGSFAKGLETAFDPNDWRNVTRNREGLILTPLAIAQGRRNGTREFVRRTKEAFPENLTIELHALAKRVIFEGERAVGVEYLKGERLYRADPRAPTNGNGRGVVRSVRARKEVILAGGAFNTPQLLKLSGVGPRRELERHGISVVVDLPGVGENLQDRYEVGHVSQVRADFALVRDASFRAPLPGEAPDKDYREWLAGRGVYRTNGTAIAVAKKLTRDKPDPDLYIFGVPGYFKGYYPGYSSDAITHRNLFTWVILKAHTQNTAGSVTLRTTDPRDVPHISFRYFEEGNDTSGADLDAVVKGIQFARKIMTYATDVVKREVLPGDDLVTDEQLRDFVRREAWGHHACGTCKIAPDDDPMGVLDGRFRVRGTRGLRVVDASIFPHIPGFFIASAIYMASEKASDVILQDARVDGDRPRPTSAVAVQE